MCIYKDLEQYVSQSILPQYDAFDGGHKRDHAEAVIRESLVLAREHGADEQMAYVIAAYHDLGLRYDRETHHIRSGEILMADERLRQWFTEEQLLIMRDAVEDHRASASRQPRSIYGKIVAEADRDLDTEVVFRRAIQFGLEKYPDITPEQQWERFVMHMTEKYSVNGYIKLWIPNSPNRNKLKQIQTIIESKSMLREWFDMIYQQEVSKT